MANLNELQTVGKNESAEISNTAKVLFNKADSLVISTQEDATNANVDLKQIKSFAKSLDEKRKSITKPLDEAKSAIMDLFRPAEDFLKQAEAKIKLSLKNYLDEEAKKLAAKKEELEIVLNVDTSKMVTSAPKISGLVVKEVWKFEITDESLIPREYLMIDESKIRSDVTALKDKASIAGIRVFVDKQLSSRA